MTLHWILVPVYACATIYVLWVYYLAVMCLKRARDEGKLTPVAKRLSNLVYLPGLILDGLVNIFLLTLLLVDTPREWLVTSRLERLQRGSGWRAAVARWFCKNLLDGFDPDGCHCKQ